ncbi:hypothetical protein [Saccharopolyspora hattusasensis]|uniref:hypothetical protein n=1 Tax=Saccharopolyspora hattusasensis TaxID=1128679 RepID=UPI003D95C676
MDPYSGSNPHTKHFHISVHANVTLADDPRPWNLPSFDSKPAQEGPDLTPEQDHMLRDILQQLTGSRNPGQFPGWPSKVDPGVSLTPVDTIRYIDKHLIEIRDQLPAMISDAVHQALTNGVVRVDVNVNDQTPESARA